MLDVLMPLFQLFHFLSSTLESTFLRFTQPARRSFVLSSATDLTRSKLPTVTLALPMMAVTARLVRTGMLDNLQEDYVRTARAKGLAPATVVNRHVLKNLLIPVTTVLGLQFGSLLAGAVIVETVFSWPGVGQLTVDGIMRRDYPVVAASVFFISFIFVIVNLAVDMVYAYLDPRIRYD